MAFEVMEDCIHLKACRRVQAIGRKHRLQVPRYCDSECTAYQNGGDDLYVTASDAFSVAVSQYDGRHDPYDVYATYDFGGMTIREILNTDYDER